ncbi:hypothetical protein LEP3755_58020 [Leptolyngbya sp. NIES-3755]|nr:hypothetical protein LEP3755_58020 [Leptolyngbya sp. NIES-3755]
MAEGHYLQPKPTVYAQQADESVLVLAFRPLNPPFWGTLKTA